MAMSEDHTYGRSTSMWNLTSYDLHRIKGQLQARRARIDAKYAEDSKALDTEFAELETLERVAAAVALKYRPDDAADPTEESSARIGEESTPIESEAASDTQPVMAPVDGGSGSDPKTASRWRLALRDRPAE
jgi:hypothetical protein